jgi:glycosyltransferase involved in cell wall biosynthesis
MPTSVSVIIPTYNRAHLVGRAIRSALACIGPDDEILVVDDGSCDDTATVVNAFDGRVRYLPGPHAGAGPTRNRGIATASRSLVAFLDSDDEWDVDKLTLQRAIFSAHPDLLFLFSDFRVHDDLENRDLPRYLIHWSHDERGWDEILGPGQLFSELGSLPTGRTDFRVHQGDMYLRLLERSYIATSTLAVRRIPAGNALRFAEDVPTYEDLECFARLARAGKAAFMDTETATQHGHRGPRVTDAGTEEMTRANLTIMNRIWGQDEGFLKQHGPHFERKVAQQHLDRARWFLCRGRTHEARKELDQVEHTPASYRLLASLPGFVTRGLLRVRRALRRGT